MDVKIDKKSDTKREIEVTIPVEEMEGYMEKAAQKAVSEMNIKGFRPGKAPRSVVENTIGKEKLFENAAREAVQETYPKIIEENKLFALSSPQVNLIKCAPGNDVVYRAFVYVMPEINLPDYRKISKDVATKSEKADVNEEEIDQAISRIRETKARTEKVDREARKGDAVIINFKGVFLGQGNTKEDGKKVEEENFQVVLGKGDLDDLKGFEDNILGMKAGEKKDFSINASTSKTEGKEEKIDFNVEMISVMNRELPDIDDEFAKSFPDIENINQLREKVKEGVLAEKRRKEKEKIKLDVLQAIKNETNFEVPDVLVEKELDNMIKTIENQLMQSGSSLDNYLKEINKTQNDLRKDWQKRAQENVSFALILHKISKDEKIEVSEEEIEQEVDQHFKAMGKNKEDETKENMDRMKAYIHDTLKNQKVFRILSIEE